MGVVNVEMARAWDGPEGEQWATHATRYERANGRQWRRFLELVPISGAATGVDLSSAMLAVARSRGAQEGLTNVRFERADAQVHPFDRAAVDLEVLNRHATPDGVLLAASSWLVTAAV